MRVKDNPHMPLPAEARKLRRAMIDNVAVEFTYSGKLRIVEVHAIGRSTKDGSIIFRGYQTGGDASRALPQWTLFSLDLVEDFSESALESLAPREGYAEDDKQMSPVLCQIAL